MLMTQTLAEFFVSKLEEQRHGVCCLHTSHHLEKFQSIAASASVAGSKSKVAVKVKSELRRL